MQCRSGKNSCCWCFPVFLILLIINIRVAAGIGTTFERAVDGLVSVAILLGAIFVALDFFQIITRNKK